MEIRNIGAVQNNNPAFGMAVIKAVKSEDAARFVTDITKDVYFLPKQVDKAVKDIMARAAKNTQFNIQPFVVEIMVDGKPQKVIHYNLMPKTGDASRIMKDQNMKKIISSRCYTDAEECMQRVEKRLNGKKGIGKLFAKVANFFDISRVAVSSIRHPERCMDSRLRYAVQYAEDCEAAVLKRLKNEKLVEDLLAAK